jgi:trimeric autotransporter adhesin
MVRRLLAFTLSVIALAFSMNAAAANSGVTYQGRILKPDGNPLTGSNVQFRLQIKSPDANSCLMYEELQTQDMSSSHGNFSLTINDGTGVRNDTSGYGLDRIFANRGIFTFNAADCVSGTDYTPGSGDGRTLQVFFKDETMSAWEPMPPQKINFVPFAFESKQVAGFGASNLLRFAESDGTLVNTSPLNNTQYTELVALVNGSSTVYEKAGKLAGGALPTLAAGQVLGWSGTAWTAVDPASSSASVLKDPDGGPNKITFQADPALASDYTITWPLNTGAANQVLTTDGTGKLTWAAPTAATQWTTVGSDIHYTAGNVGVGTASPIYALDVQRQDASAIVNIQNKDTTSAARFPGVAAINHMGSTGNGVPVFALMNSAGSFTTPSPLPLNKRLGSLVFRGGNGVGPGSYNQGAVINANSEEIFSATAGGTNLVFATTPTGTTSAVERLRIAGNGNIGIGTAAPTDQLHVAGSASPTVLVQATTTNTASNLRLTSGATNGIVRTFGETHATKPSLMEIGTIGGTGALAFLSANGAERMRVDSAGNVGIGTTLPTSILHVNGATPIVTLNDTNSSSYSTLAQTTGQMSFRTNATTGPILFDVNPTVSDGNSTSEVRFFRTTNTTGAKSFKLFRGDGTTQLDAQLHVGTSGSSFLAGSGGNVGIGTASPNAAYKLDVNGAINATSMKINGVDVAAAANYWTKSITDISYSGGNVGIGTATPTYPLDVTGSIRSTSSMYGFNYNALSSGPFSPLVSYNSAGAANEKYWDFFHSGTSFGIRAVNDAYTGSNEAITFQRSGNTITNTLIPSGNVGIGTASPDTKLHVVGGIHATGNSTFNGDLAFGSNLYGPSIGVGRGGSDGYSSAMASVPYAGYQAANSWHVDNNLAGTRFYLFNGNSVAQAALFSAVSVPGASTYSPAFVWGQQTDSAGAYAERMRMDPNGKLGIGTTAPTELLEVSGNVKVKHVVGSGLAPNVLAVTGAGTGATISVSAGSTDLAGVITLNTGTAPAANSQVFVLGFRSSYASAPSCVFSAGSADAAAKISAVYMQSNIANMGLWTTATALNASSMYVWHYHCAQ